MAGVANTGEGFGKRIGVEWAGRVEVIWTGENPEAPDIEIGEGIRDTGDGVIPNLMFRGEGASVCVGGMIEFEFEVKGGGMGDGVDKETCVGDGGVGEFENGTGDDGTNGTGETLGEAFSNSGEGEEEWVSCNMAESGEECGDELWLLRSYLLSFSSLDGDDCCEEPLFKVVFGLLTFLILPCLRFCSLDWHLLEQ